jgi:Na+(H+)/acetate symporter ActP
LSSVLQSGDIKSKIWAFVISSIAGSFFFTLIYSKWKKSGTVIEGLKFGSWVGIWMGLNMSLNTYASTGLVPFTLAMQWLAFSIIQYALAGCLVAFAFNFKMKSINRAA